MRYLLDTNICIYIAKQKPPGVLARLQRLKAGDVGMSIITHLELVYGACKCQGRQENLSRIRELERLIPVLPMDTGVGRHFGEVRAALERKGTPIGAYDLLIAAHALSLGLILVTDNAREFRRIPQLNLENWAEEAP
jgi:tRNA(fMet)-specific endonuclease VapC